MTYLWRGSLLPLGCEAALTVSDTHDRDDLITSAAASHPSGSKLPRHKMELTAGLSWPNIF
ncbi:hypothetical protein EAH78_01270 [Pseudomonas arsenicoxydans]|uniref:Uncharacterized protein n=1 Tax=Pseudomonas arsenicoxydans TaxID=702115 RepID=A0A502I8C7_9PSED|nr:hypothetical protein EAH78_01270 [Pseudomonas arsenicoxydans]